MNCNSISAVDHEFFDGAVQKFFEKRMKQYLCEK